MRKNFLIVSGLLALGLLIVFIHSQISFAASSVVATNAASATNTDATLNGEVTTVNLGGYLTAGFNFGSTTASAGAYDSTTTDVSTASTSAGSWSHATTSLSKGHVYFFRAYVATTTYGVTSTDGGIGYGSEASFITGLEEPNDLAKTLGSEGKLTLSWTTTTGAHTVNVEVRYLDTAYPASITAGTQGCQVNGTSCTVTGLTCGTTYYLRAWATTTDLTGGMSTSSNNNTQLTTKTADCTPTTTGGGSRTLTSPTTYADSLVINQGAATTESREVTLTLRASNVSLMTICSDSNFLGCGLEDYSATKSWELTEGDGAKTVYVKFVSPDGMNSDVISGTITLETPALVEEEVVEEVPEEAVEEEVVEEEVVEEVPEEAVEEEEAVTAEGLRAKIETLQLQLLDFLRQFIELLQEQLAAVGQFFASLF